MIAAALALVAAQAVPAESGLALFRDVCVNRTRTPEQVETSPVSFAALPAAAHATLARVNTAYETLDGDRFAAFALPGGAIYLILPAAGTDPEASPAAGCVVLWTGPDIDEARTFVPPYEAHVALQKNLGDGWIMMRTIRSAAVAAPSP